MFATPARPTTSLWLRPLLAGAGLVLALSAAGCQATNPFPDTYVGVGVELKMNPDGPTVVRVIEGGPASMAGVSPGTVLLAIDGHSTKDMNLADVVNALRGPPGSQLVVSATSSGRNFQVTMLRAALKKAGGDGKYTATP
jgi:C-terminal processing protease CtpA/Prc